MTAAVLVSPSAIARPSVATAIPAASIPIIPRPAPGIAYIEPRFVRSGSFVGAALPVCGIDVLIVVVQPAILANVHESNLYVIAFQTRFQRAIVLMAQDAACVPTYYGPAAIVRTLSTLPFELIPWQRMLYRVAKPPPFKLPIPPRDEPEETPYFGSSDLSSSDSHRSDLSRSDLARTCIRVHTTRR